MHEKSVSHTRIQNLCVCVGGGGVGGGFQACLPENNLDNFLSPQLQYFTFNSYREGVLDPCMPP